MICENRQQRKKKAEWDIVKSDADQEGIVNQDNDSHNWDIERLVTKLRQKLARALASDTASVLLV